MNSQVHDEFAYPIVAGIIDYAEGKMVESRRCQPEDAGQYLTGRYFEECSCMVAHGVQYSECDERIGADIFLSSLPAGPYKAQYRRNSRRCAAHLASQPWLHFVDYKPLLRIAFLNVLRTIDNVHELRFHGIVLLACGTLDNAATDVRRELRRRGLSYDPTLVAEDTIQRRIGSSPKPVSRRIKG